jgi:hypothetical protein
MAKVIANSLVLDSSEPEYLSQTLAAGDNTLLWTFSCWFKRGRSTGDFHTFFSAGTLSTNYTDILLDNADRLVFRHRDISGFNFEIETFARFRDVSAWHHLVVQYDSAQGTAADRATLWVDGVELIEFDTGSFPGASDATDINTATPHYIGQRPDGVFHFDGHLAEIHFADGTAYTPTDFGEQNNNSWQPKEVSITYGTNGFKQEFLTSGDMGDDTSGNANDWTLNGIAAANQRVDSPTHNHGTLNQNDTGSLGTVTSGGRILTGTGSHGMARSTFMLPQTGKWYWETDAISAPLDGPRSGVTSMTHPRNSEVGETDESWGLRNQSGTVLSLRHNGSDTAFTDTGTFQTGDYVMHAVDMDTLELWIGLNGTWLDSGDPANGTGSHVTLNRREIIPAISVANTQVLEFRTQDSDYEGTKPSGFSSLQVNELSEPTIIDPSLYFDIVEWSGDSSNPRVISGLNFDPDMVWIKSHDIATSHVITDSERGVPEGWFTDVTVAPQAAPLNGEVSALGTEQFTVDAGGTSDNSVNDSTSDYTAFVWKKDALAGFDMQTWVGTGVAKTETHALGVIPDFILTKNRDTVSDAFVLAMRSLNTASAPLPDPETDRGQLSVNSAFGDLNTAWDDTAPTDSVFTVGSATGTNESPDDYIGYLWAEVEGFSKFVSYRGDGLNEGPFIYTQGKPKFALIKDINDNNEWMMFFPNTEFHGKSSQGSQGVDNWFNANTNGIIQEASGTTFVTFCNNGIKIHSSGFDTNRSGNEYLVMVFNETPFKYASSGIDTSHTGNGLMPMAAAINAQGLYPTKRGNGAPAMTAAINATGTNKTHHGNAVPAATIAIAGTGINKTHHGNAVPAATMAIAAVGINSAHHGSAPDMPMSMSVPFATGSQPAHHGNAVMPMNMTILGSGILGNITATITMPIMTVNGTVVRGNATSALALNIPALQVTGSIAASHAYQGSPRIPQLQINGLIEGPKSVTLPSLTINGIICNGAVVTGDVTLPFLQTNGFVLNPNVGTSTGKIAALQATGTILTGAAISGSISLPALKVLSLLDGENLISGTLTLPAFCTDPAMAPLAAGSLGEGLVILPMLRLDGTIVNAVALTQTVWAMNTESFETTNYLNFDFDTLVSFAEQPYGVTTGGIFLLEGTDDDGTNIDAEFLTGIEDRDDEHLKEVDGLYMAYTGGNLVLRLFPDGQTRVREYPVERISDSAGVKHARFKGARGLRSRTYQLGMKNQGGADFKIDKMGLLLRILSRKTRKN